MNTIRFRLTLAFAGALVATVFAFSLAVWAARRSGATEQVRAAAVSEADMVIEMLRQAEESGQPVTRVGTRDTLPVLSPPLSAVIAGMTGYVAVIARDGRLLGLSQDARDLSRDEVTYFDSTAANAGRNAQLITLAGERQLMVVRQTDASRSRARCVPWRRMRCASSSARSSSSSRCSCSRASRSRT